jgi:hypothetical protein
MQVVVGRNRCGIKMGYLSVSYFPWLECERWIRVIRLTITKRTRRVDATLLIAFAQFVIIVLLLSGVSAEYQSNRYMQEWIAQNAWPVGYLLNGYLASTLVGVAIGGGFLLLQRWRSTGDLQKK